MEKSIAEIGKMIKNTVTALASSQMEGFVTCLGVTISKEDRGQLCGLMVASTKASW
jgi:hypothetical protein